MSLPRFSVENRVLVNMLMWVVLIGGAMFACTLVREMFPESRPNKLAIMAVYPGIQPVEIEKAVTIKVEEAVRDIEGIEKVDSTVTEGVSTTMLTLYNDVEDVDTVLQEVKNEVDALQDLPDDLEEITVSKFEPKMPVISVAIFGNGDESDLKRAARSLRDELLLLPGVSDVEITGTRQDEISVEVRPERLMEYNVTFDEIAAAIAQTNLDVSGGQLKGDRTAISVRTLGEEYRGRDLEDIIVRSRPDGRKIHLREVAIIRDDFIESDLESYFNAKPAVNVVVYKTDSQDAIQIATQIKAFIYGKQNLDFDPYGYAAAADDPWYVQPFSLMNAGLAQIINTVAGRPDPLKIYEESRRVPFDHNFEVALHTDLARFVEGRLDLMIRNGKSGLILVLASLVLFLNFRVAFWAAVGLPVAFLGTFIVMWAFGVSINLLSLFGLIIVLGIIVDDAIVIGENIHRHVEEGMPPREAAVHGAEEVMWPVVIAVSTTVAAFVPMLFIKGRIGDFMRELPIVVAAALSVSLLEALVILPAHLSEMPSKKARREKREREGRDGRSGRLGRMMSGLQRSQEWLIQGVLANIYERFLRLAIRWRYVAVAAAVSTLFASIGLLAGGIVDWKFIQKLDSETLICALEMPVGTTADQTKARLQKLSEYVVATPEVVNVQTFVALQIDLGGDGAGVEVNQPHLGQLIVELRPADERDQDGQRSSDELMADFRNFSREQLAGVNSVTWEGMNGGPGGKDIMIRITGKEFDQLVEVAERLKTELSGYEGVEGLDDDHDEGKREIRLRLRESARPTGITVGALGHHVRSAMYGHEAKRITRNREDVKIMVRYPERFRKDVYHLESMWIPTGTTVDGRGWVPLGEIAELTESDSYTAIHRSQQERSVTVLGDVGESASASEILAKINEKFENEISPQHPGVRIEFLGSAEEQQKAFTGLKLAFPVALLLIYMMLAGLFRSYIQPVVVMSAIPFGIQGAIIGHWVTGETFTILSGIGLIALTGIVVNDSLVLVDFINGRVRQGADYFEASVDGARLRLRAILLTTLTTVAGLAPLMFETSFQAKFLIPMAVTLTFGLSFATVLTLIIVPCLNMIFFDLRSKALALVGRRDADPLVAERSEQREQIPQAAAVEAS